MNESKKIGLAIIGLLAFTYVALLLTDVACVGRDYSCLKVPRFRVDYIFPARQISCYLYTEVQDETK